MAQKPNGFRSLEEVADAIASYQPHRRRPRVLEGLKKNVRLDENNRMRWHWDPAWLDDKRRIAEIDARWERRVRYRHAIPCAQFTISRHSVFLHRASVAALPSLRLICPIDCAFAPFCRWSHP